mmetsp:Transcript_45181/g.88708  ORF Transcript_45181/g.88708 Transcript_45181/m.88708 type:complete len:242 (-) Transcript_45181:292-1017(-)
MLVSTAACPWSLTQHTTANNWNTTWVLLSLPETRVALSSLCTSALSFVTRDSPNWLFMKARRHLTASVRAETVRRSGADRACSSWGRPPLEWKLDIQSLPLPDSTTCRLCSAFSLTSPDFKSAVKCCGVLLLLLVVAVPLALFELCRIICFLAVSRLRIFCRTASLKHFSSIKASNATSRSVDAPPASWAGSVGLRAGAKGDTIMTDAALVWFLRPDDGGCAGEGCRECREPDELRECGGL